MARLVAIGDSLTQGFQNGAIFKTDWSYPAMIARSMGLHVPLDFRVPTFRGSGLPLNIEWLLREMQRDLGSDISTIEWIVSFPYLLQKFLDKQEDLYERGAGSRPQSSGQVFHNLAVWGFRVIDALKVSSRYCDRMIDEEEGVIEDDVLGMSAPKYRTARIVLNPRQSEERKDWTVLECVRQLRAEADDERIENLILWLGANDCLGTVLDLEFKDMPQDVPDDPKIRSRWNLTHPDVFERDYRALVGELTDGDALKGTNVFVGTVPHVTIPPVTQGIPPYDGKYFAYYGRFFANARNFSPVLHRKLTRDQAEAIDLRIDRFNAIIETVVQEQKDAGNAWYLVKTGKMLDALAVKRNQMTDTPERPLRDFYARKRISDHPLFHLDPIPNALRFTTRGNRRVSGGIFSLDCVHPTTIGYGLVAEAFLRAMQKAGVRDADPARLDWQAIIAQDSLIQQPPLLWDDILETAERHSTIWDVLFRCLSL